MRKVLLLAVLFMLAALPACAGSGGADQGQVRELKNENAELREELEEVKDKNAELEEELASAEAQAAEASASASGSASASASQSAGAERTADKECSIGKECDLGQSSVTVTSAERTQQINIDFSSSVYAGEYVVVEYDYTYGGSSPVTVDEPEWAIQDAEGTEYSLNWDVTSSYEIDRGRELMGAEVQPGVPTSGAAVFEVAPGAKDLVLFVVDLSNPQQGDVAQIPLG